MRANPAKIKGAACVTQAKGKHREGDNQIAKFPEEFCSEDWGGIK
jgi:hypothetical protein